MIYLACVRACMCVVRGKRKKRRKKKKKKEKKKNEKGIKIDYDLIKIKSCFGLVGLCKLSEGLLRSNQMCLLILSQIPKFLKIKYTVNYRLIGT